VISFFFIRIVYPCFLLSEFLVVPKSEQTEKHPEAIIEQVGANPDDIRFYSVTPPRHFFIKLIEDTCFASLINKQDSRQPLSAGFQE
jgi:hypothetical protein